MGARTSTPVIEIGGPRRSSYELPKPPGNKVAGRNNSSPSAHSLPNDVLKANGFGVVGKGLQSSRSPKAPRSRIPSQSSPGYEGDFKNFDYESDFETDEEDANVTLSNATLTKMKMLKKRRENMKEIERKRQERENKKLQEERVRKYKQLELQHSQNSLQPSRASSGGPDLAVSPNVSYQSRSPRGSPRRSPINGSVPSHKPFSRSVPKSKSHTSNLSKNLGPPVSERRHRSLERQRVSPMNKATPETFRTPQLVRRGQPPGRGSGSNNLSNSLGSNSGGTNSFGRRSVRRLPERSSEDLSMPTVSVGMRTTKPASSCFKNHLEPFPNPHEALKNSHLSINSDDWENQVDGIQGIVRLTEHHPEVLQADLHNVNLSLLKQAKNLRSQVSRASIQAFSRLFDAMKRNMEPDVDKIANLLLHRTADTNKFLQLDSHHALDALVENIAPAKSIPVIIQEGLGHKNPVVRTTVARLLAYEVERLGPSRVLSGQKDITDRLLPAAAKLAQEGSLETRKYAKQIFHTLMRQGDFDAALKKHVTPNEIRNIQKFLDNLSGEGRSIQESARSKFSVGGSRYTRSM